MITRGIVLLLAAGVAFGILRLTYGQRPVYVHVRWAPTVDLAMRKQMEQAHGLIRGELREGMTWGYFITDLSAANLQDLVQSAHVEDTVPVLDPGKRDIGRRERAAPAAHEAFVSSARGEHLCSAPLPCRPGDCVLTHPNLRVSETMP